MQQKILATTSKLVFLVIISHFQYHIFKQECTACTLTPESIQNENYSNNMSVHMWYLCCYLLLLQCSIAATVAF